MARRRTVKRARRASVRSFARRAARRGGVGNSAALVQVDAMAYGAVRAPLSNWIQSVVPIPVIGSIGDEVAMGLVNYMVAKNTGGMLKKVAMKGLVVENARLGETLTQGFGLTKSSSGSAYLYG